MNSDGTRILKIDYRVQSLLDLCREDYDYRATTFEELVKKIETIGIEGGIEEDLMREWAKEMIGTFLPLRFSTKFLTKEDSWRYIKNELEQFKTKLIYGDILVCFRLLPYLPEQLGLAYVTFGAD